MLSPGVVVGEKLNDGRRWKPCRVGELDHIISLALTESNIRYLNGLLDRSPGGLKSLIE